MGLRRVENAIALFLLVVAPAFVIGEVAPAFSAGRSIVKSLCWVINTITLFLLVIARVLIISQVAPALSAG